MTISGLFLLTLSAAIVVASVLSDWDYWPFAAVIGSVVTVAIPVWLSPARKRNRLGAWLLVVPILYMFAFGPYVAALNTYSGKPWAEWNTVASRIIFPGHIYVLNHPSPSSANAAYTTVYTKLKAFSRAWHSFGFNLHWFMRGFAGEFASHIVPRDLDEPSDELKPSNTCYLTIGSIPSGWVIMSVRP